MNKHANTSTPGISVEDYADPTGRFRPILKLWERYCGITLQIEKLQKELNEVQAKLLEQDQSFFDVKHTPAGISFPFLPEQRGRRKSNLGIVLRNAFILNSRGRTVRKICQGMDGLTPTRCQIWRRLDMSDHLTSAANLHSAGTLPVSMLDLACKSRRFVDSNSDRKLTCWRYHGVPATARSDQFVREGIGN